MINSRIRRRTLVVLSAIPILSILGMTSVLSFGAAAFWILISLTFLYRVPAAGVGDYGYTVRGASNWNGSGSYTTAGAVAAFAFIDVGCGGDGGC